MKGFFVAILPGVRLTRIPYLLDITNIPSKPLQCPFLAREFFTHVTYLKPRFVRSRAILGAVAGNLAAIVNCVFARALFG